MKSWLLVNSLFSFFFSVLLLTGVGLHAQNFGDNNPVWNYNVSSGWGQGGLNYHLRLSVEKDTTFLGKQCKILTSGNPNYMPYKNMICQDSAKVVFWSPSLQEFQTLYDFKAKKGAYWKAKLDGYHFGPNPETACFLVDSVYLQTINGKTLNVQRIRIDSDSLSVYAKEFPDYLTETVIESVGCTQFLFPWDYSGVDGDHVHHLRCFEDDSIGFFQFDNSVTCDYTHVGIEEAQTALRNPVFPNPNNGNFSIYGINTNAQLNTIEVMDVQGKEIPINYSLTNEGISISIENVKTGFYFIKLELNNGEFIREKVIVQD